MHLEVSNLSTISAPNLLNCFESSIVKLKLSEIIDEQQYLFCICD